MKSTTGSFFTVVKVEKARYGNYIPMPVTVIKTQSDMSVEVILHVGINVSIK